MRHVALLRGINVGKHNRIKMSDLRASLEAHGVASAETYLQSGNVLFEWPAESLEDLEQRFQYALTDLGVTSHVIVRSAEEMTEVVSVDPFKDIDIPDSHKMVHFLKSSCLETLPTQTPKADAQVVLQKPKEIYTAMLISQGRPPDLGFLLKKVGAIPTTSRNWIVTRDLQKLLSA
jgi:uncharacterized protein (DUF1697 family)